MAYDLQKSTVMIMSTDNNSFEDACCSICLEPFNSDDPPTMTECKHEYHLQCILEWSQRSKECPFCWQNLVLKDPSSQELLDAVEIERNMRSRWHSVSHTDEDIEAIHPDYSEFEEGIIEHVGGATSRVRLVSSRRRQTSPGVGLPQVLPSVPMAAMSNHAQINGSSVEGLDFEISGDGSPASGTSYSTEPASSSGPGHIGGPAKFSQSVTGSPQRSSPSELLAFSESIKSKWSAASARYKVSISKSTRGFKEKLLARNTSVKEFGKEVQREMSAGIAGVARMIERLDLTPKRAGASVPVSSCTMDRSDLFNKGEHKEENVMFQSYAGCTKNSASEASPSVTN